MKYTSLFTLLLVSSIAFAGNWEKRSLSYFNEIKISGNLRVELVKSDTAGIEVFDICCSMSEIKIDQSGRLLKINYDKGLVNDNEYDIIVYYTSLSEITVQRGARLECREDMEENAMNIIAHSGSNINLGMKLEYLDIMATAGSAIHIDGEIDFLKANVNAGASLEMNRAKTRKADVKALTGGNVSFQVEEEIKAVAGTGGNIEYSGNPRVTDIDTHLGGIVHCNNRSVE